MSAHNWYWEQELIWPTGEAMYPKIPRDPAIVAAEEEAERKRAMAMREKNFPVFLTKLLIEVGVHSEVAAHYSREAVNITMLKTMGSGSSPSGVADLLNKIEFTTILQERRHEDNSLLTTTTAKQRKKRLRKEMKEKELLEQQQQQQQQQRQQQQLAKQPKPPPGNLRPRDRGKEQALEARQSSVNTWFLARQGQGGTSRREGRKRGEKNRNVIAPSFVV